MTRRGHETAERRQAAWLSRPATWIGVGLVLVALVLWPIPWLLTRVPRISDPVAQHTAMSEVRTVLVGAAVAIGAGIGLWYTARTYLLSRMGHLNDRFQRASALIGDDKETVQLAGLYAMAQLADEWVDQRQTCVDVLCAYARLAADPGSSSAARAEGRRTVFRLVSQHLQRGCPVSWDGLTFDLRRALLDGADFAGMVITRGRLLLDETDLGGAVFDCASFEGADVSMRRAAVSRASTVSFRRAQFVAGRVNFDGVDFQHGDISFDHSQFRPDCRVTFRDAKIGTPATVSFDDCLLVGEAARGEPVAGVSFRGLTVASGRVAVGFRRTTLERMVRFDGSEINRTIAFDDADLTRASLSFEGADLAAGVALLRFPGARFGTGLVIADDACQRAFAVSGAVGRPAFREPEVTDGGGPRSPDAARHLRED